MQPLARRTLAGHGRPHVAHSEAVGHRGAPGRLDLRAHRAQAGAGLARRDDVAQAERRRIDACLSRAPGQVGRERQRAVDRREPQAGDEVEQALRLANAHGHDSRAGGLERHVVGDAAGVERVVQAVRDDVAVAHAGDGEGGAADGRVGLVVGAREADGHRIPGCPRRDVQAHERLGRRAKVLAEGRPRGLRSAQLCLGQQRDVLERPRAGQPLAVEGRAALQVGELGSQRDGVGHARTLADRQRDGPPDGRPVVAMFRGECRVRWRRDAEPARFLTSYDASYAERFPPSSAGRTILASTRRMRRITEPDGRFHNPRTRRTRSGAAEPTITPWQPPSAPGPSGPGPCGPWAPCRACARTWR